MLTGYRGAPQVDVDALESIVLRVAQLVEAAPEIVEMDCNPVVAAPSGAVVVDVKMRCRPAPGDPGH